MKYLKDKRVLAGIGGVLVLLSTYYIYGRVTNTVEPYKVPVLSESYANTEHKFALIMPEGFTARESSDGESDTIVFENEKAEGIQIVISPFEDVKVLTREMIESDIPDMQISDEQVVEIGNNHQGLAFKSDNPSFDGASREVWFVFNGELYQISTYERLDELLKAMFGTWQFDLNK